MTTTRYYLVVDVTTDGKPLNPAEVGKRAFVGIQSFDDLTLPLPEPASVTCSEIGTYLSLHGLIGGALGRIGIFETYDHMGEYKRALTYASDPLAKLLLYTGEPGVMVPE